MAPEPWSRRRRMLVSFGGISLVLLGLLATSFSSTDIAAAAGGVANAARILTAVALLVALPIVVKPHVPGVSVAARATVVAAALVVILAIAIPPGQQWPLAPLWVVGLVVSAAVYALLLRLGRARDSGGVTAGGGRRLAVLRRRIGRRSDRRAAIKPCARTPTAATGGGVAVLAWNVSWREISMRPLGA